MRTLRLVSAMISVAVTGPIWLYVLYQVLVAIRATEVTWLLFWVYCPATVVVMTLQVLAARHKAEADHAARLEKKQRDLEALYQNINRRKWRPWEDS